MNANHLVNGANMIYTLCGLGGMVLAALYITYLRKHPKFSWKQWATLLTGCYFLMCLAFVIRVGGWLPWRGFREAGNKQDLVTKYADLATIWTSLGAVFCVAGMLCVTWLPLRDRYGSDVAMMIVLSGVVVAFFAGVGLTHMIAVWVR